LWALLGISGASLAGSGLIKNSKENQDEPPAAVVHPLFKKIVDKGSETVTADASGNIQPARGPSLRGVSIVNDDPKDAKWLDIFQGEELGNKNYLDIGKTQMFFFTIIVWVSYATSLGGFLIAHIKIGGGAFEEMPLVSTGMVTLLGISHAAYLANKAVPHTPEHDSTKPDSKPA
jgi:hypothetical protein